MNRVANRIIPVVYVTKYALTIGIQRYENAEHCVDISDKMIRLNSGVNRVLLHKPYWHETLDDAIRQAEKMRETKIASLQSQIDYLKTLSF